MKPQRVVEPSEEVAPKQSTKALEIPKDLDHQFSKMLRELVYPQLQEALLDICEKMADDGEIRKYLETNLEQRVFDHEEKRQIESRLLREQFGDEYPDSDDEENEDRATKKKKALEETFKDEGENELSEHEGENKHDMTNMSDSAIAGADNDADESIKPVEAVLENIKEEDEIDNIKVERYTYDPFRKMGPNAFNPILYLGTLLKKMANDKKKKQVVFVENISADISPIQRGALHAFSHPSED